MANRIDEIIEKVKNDAETNDVAKELLDSLLKAKEKLGDNPSEEEEEKMIMECLLSQARDSDDNSAEHKEEIEKFMTSACSVVEGFFEKDDWNYSTRRLRTDVTIYEMGVGLRNCRLRLRVYIEADPKVCRIDAILPISADSTYDYVLCYAMAKENFPRRFGSLQYDLNDGEISYRYSFPISHGIYEDDFGKALYAVASSADESFEIIKKCCIGKFKQKEINEILTKVNDLVSDISESE